MHVLCVTAISDTPEIHLMRGLAQRGVNLHVVHDPREPRVEFLREGQIKTTALAIKHRLDLRAIAALRTIMNERRYDLIYSPFNRGLSTSILASLGMSIVFTTYRGTLGNLSYWDPSNLLAHLNPKVSAIICNCNAVKKSVHSIGVPEHKLHVIYKGHSTKWYQAPKRADLSAYPIPVDAAIVGCIANARSNKGIDVLLRAAKSVQLDREVHYLVVGDMRDSNLQQLVQNLGLESNVHFAGYRKDVNELIKCCDVTVVPSVRREGLARVIIESLSQRVPVIVTDVGGMPEVVIDRQCGLVVPPGDSHALATAINELLSDDAVRKQLGEQGYQYIQNHLSPDQYHSKVYELFRSLLGKQG